MKSKTVAAHFKVNAKGYEQLKGESAVDGWPFIRGYEVRIDPTQPDDWGEIVDAHTVKSHPFVRLGKHFWWGDTLWVNPLDERLLL